MREIRLDGPFILLNGKRLFLRGYGDDHIYPEQMAMPADKDLHLQRLRVIKSYGFNHVRHHSTIMPPEYYDACDEVGILPTAEFPIAYDSFLPGGANWKQNVPPGTDTGPAWETYRREWAAAIRRHRNHPSIFAWVMGNELWNGIPQRHDFRRIARELDPRRLFADTDGVTEMWQHILDPKNDRETLDVYFLMFDVFRNPLDLPDKFKTPRPIKPVISHESGNYVTFTRPDAADAFRHNIKPFWMTEGRAKLERLGLLGEAQHWAEKSERLYLLLHKTDLEALRQNPFISGYHWWLFQDYWTTANGLVDHSFRPKSITAEEVRRFNNEVVLLQNGLDSTYRGGAATKVKLLVSNFSPEPFAAGQGSWQLLANGRVMTSDQIKSRQVGQGEVAEVAEVGLTLPEVESPTPLQLRVEWREGSARQPGATPASWRNEWTAWVYPTAVKTAPLPVPALASPGQLKRWPKLGLAPIPKNGALPSRAVYMTGRLDRRVLAAVERGACLVLPQGGRVFNSRPLTYRSTWWKAGDDLNANLCGTVVYDHPITRLMAPDGWCDVGWFHLLEGGRKIVLEDLPARPQVIIRALPSLRAVQDEAILFEVGVGEGALVVSGLNHDKASGQPENDWLLAQLLAHAATLPRPDVKWPASALSIPDDPALDQALSGFQKLIRNEGEEGTWYSYCEDNVTLPICRQTQPGHLVEWETAATPPEGKDERVTFVFAGGLGYQSEPKTDGFLFLVNGADQVRFDLPEQTNQWRSADGLVAIRFVPLRHLPQDQLGLFQVTLSRTLCPPGQACRFGVRSLGQGSRRWFGLNLYTDVLGED
jgi:beta-galactosidase